MHPQIIRSLALLGCTSLAVANDIVSLILPNVDQQDLVGEVIGTDGPLTTYLIQCPDGADSNDCGIPPEGLTVTAGDDTFIFDYTYEDYWLRQSCSHRGTTWFSCAVTNTQSDFSTVMTTATSVDMPYQAVTITATATDSDNDSSTTVTSTRSSSAAQPSETDIDDDSEEASTTSSGAESSTTPSPTASEEADAEETTSDNAAMAQVTGSAAQWLVSGAGMALALVLA
ncbi:hypothetical protein ASPCAL11490 [Aspergillus calidoustus]|uniref:GPI anchored protein n=1 Tax=Aspergillus calidoustus TaxID=454130 RepID=A0A0U5G9T0_ASPCI|nr:hypothetical protein ASPCAL11490 [Aspergillus calidoustus]